MTERVLIAVAANPLTFIGIGKKTAFEQHCEAFKTVKKIYVSVGAFGFSFVFGLGEGIDRILNFLRKLRRTFGVW